MKGRGEASMIRRFGEKRIEDGIEMEAMHVSDSQADVAVVAAERREGRLTKRRN